MATARRMQWTEADYLAFENHSPEKHEYLNGEIFAMAGARPNHNFASAAAIAALTAALNRPAQRCRVFTSDQRIHIPTTGLYTYADGGIVCGPLDLHTDGLSLRNPVLLFEVLSPATRDYDLGAKREHYQHIPSLQHIVLIDPDSPTVWHDTRDTNGAWQARQLGPADSLDLAALGGVIPVSALYPTEA